MNILQAIILGLTQGLTEFIPVSSSGHLTILPYLFDWPTPSLIFDIALHTGTLIALIFFFRKKLKALAKDLFVLVKDRKRPQSENERLYLNVLLATVPATIVGFLAKDLIEEVYKNSTGSTLDVPIIYTATALIVVGVLFVAFDRFVKFEGQKLESLGPIGAILIGIAQALALFRGVSRSGITLLTGRGLKLSRVAAAEFSFLMSIPILILTTIYGIYELLQLDISTIGEELGMALIGGAVAAISGLLAIRFMLKFLEKNGLLGFGVYRMLFGLLILLIVL